MGSWGGVGWGDLAGAQQPPAAAALLHVQETPAGPQAQHCARGACICACQRRGVQVSAWRRGAVREPPSGAGIAHCASCQPIIISTVLACITAPTPTYARRTALLEWARATGQLSLGQLRPWHHVALQRMPGECCAHLAAAAGPRGPWLLGCPCCRGCSCSEAVCCGMLACACG